MSEDPDVMSRPARRPDRTEVTGPADTDVHDVWEPEPGRARGVTVGLVHGGFWRARYDRTHLAPLAEALARDGFHVASLEYPRVGMPGGGWPGTAHAVRTGVAALVADARLPDRLVLVGHSAGGHLVTWLAAQETTSGVLGVVGLGPVADLGAADRLGLGEHAARDLLGGAPHDAPTAWAAADPARHPLHVPTVLLSGERDDVVPVEVVDSYAATRADDAPLTTVLVPGADHFDLIDPEHPAYAVLLDAIAHLAAA